jgi:periplasmic copper chaperone A
VFQTGAGASNRQCDMRWQYSAFAGLIFTLNVFSSASEEAAVVSVRNAWIREAPPGVSMMAGYMELRNSSSRPQVLVAASSPAFESVMIHRTIIKDGIAGMAHASQVELTPNASFIFAPGGYHLMLMTPKRALRAGDPVIIKLEFRGGLVLPVAFEVRK